MTYPNSAFCRLLALTTCVALSGCGGGSSSSPESSDSTQTGQFLDSAVEGLVYQRYSDNAMTGEGVTNASGEFEYLDDETVIFLLGEQPIGYGVGEEVVTPFDILPLTGTVSDDRVINVARLLQSLDASGDVADGITLPPPAALDGLDEIDFDDEVSLEETLEAILGGDAVLVSAQEARAHLLTTLAGLDRLPVKAEDLEASLVHFEYLPRLNCTPVLDSSFSSSNVQLQLNGAGDVEIVGTLTPSDGGALVDLEPAVLDESGAFSGQLSDGVGAYKGGWSRGRSWGSLLAPEPEEACTSRVGFARSDAMRPRFVPRIASLITHIEDQTQRYELDLRVTDFFGVLQGPGILTYAINGEEQPEVEGSADGSLDYAIGPMPIGAGFEWEYLVGYDIAGEEGVISTGGSVSAQESDAQDEGAVSPSGSFAFCAEDYSLQHCAGLLASPPAPPQQGFFYEVERRENRAVTPSTGGFCGSLPGSQPPLTVESFAGSSSTEITLPNGMVLDPTPLTSAGSADDRTSCKICYLESGESCGDLN